MFNDKAQQERLPKPAYRALRATITRGEAVDLATADASTTAPKDWAVEHGAAVIFGHAADSIWDPYALGGSDRVQLRLIVRPCESRPLRLGGTRVSGPVAFANRENRFSALFLSELAHRKKKA